MLYGDTVQRLVFDFSINLSGKSKSKVSKSVQVSRYLSLRFLPAPEYNGGEWDVVGAAALLEIPVTVLFGQISCIWLVTIS